MASLKSRCSYGCCYHVSALLGRWHTKAFGFIQAWHTCFIIYRRKCSNDITFSWSSVTDSILHDQICNTVNNHLEQFLNIHHKLVYVVMMITKLRHCPKKKRPVQHPYKNHTNPYDAYVKTTQHPYEVRTPDILAFTYTLVRILVKICSSSLKLFPNLSGGTAMSTLDSQGRGA